MTIEEGTEYILSHFTGDNALWPRWCATVDYWPCQDRKKSNRDIPEGSIKSILERFYDANLLNCRLCPYPDFIEDYAKSDSRHAWIRSSVGIVPELIMIDLDFGAFGVIEELDLVLYQTLDRINELFHGNFKPTVMGTGHGYHIYLPVQMAGDSWCLGCMDEFINLHRTPDQEFLRWAERYISNGKCDPEHTKGVSFKNMWLRVPGSFNVKDGEPTPVVLIQKWDRQRPYTNWILRDFYNYLIDKKHKPKSKKRYDTTLWRNSTKWD